MHLLGLLLFNFVQDLRSCILDSAFGFGDVLGFGGGFVLVAVSRALGLSFEGFVFLPL